MMLVNKCHFENSYFMPWRCFYLDSQLHVKYKKCDTYITYINTQMWTKLYVRHNLYVSTYAKLDARPYIGKYAMWMRVNCKPLKILLSTDITQHMLRSNKSWTWGNSSLRIWKIIVDETREVHKSSHLEMLFKAGVLKNFPIFIGKHLCGTLF